MKKYNVTLKGRYTRLLFLITDQFTYDSILSVIFENQSIWGGRFNPIIEVFDNKIPEVYLTRAIEHDPDIIYYDPHIDINSILQSYNLNPYYTEPINMETPWHVVGTNTYFLAAEHKSRKVVFPGTGYWQIEDGLKDWYRVNFGLSPYTNYRDQLLTRENPILEVTSQNYDDLLSILAENDQLLFKTILSQLRAEQEIDILPNKDGDLLEFIVGDWDSRTDLLYYANRVQYKNKGLLYFTLNEFKILIHKPDFWHFIRAQRFIPKIKIKTATHTIELLQSLLHSSLYSSAHKMFDFSKIENFPYVVTHKNDEARHTIFQSTQTIITQNGLITVPALPKSISPDIYGWSIDISLRDVTDSTQAPVYFPRYTKTSPIVGTPNSRINAGKTISALIDRETTIAGVIGIHIPNPEEIIKIRLTSEISGASTEEKIQHCTRSDDSNRLLGLLNIIQNDFEYIEKILDDYFWGEWIRNISKKESVTAFSSRIIIEELSAALLETNQGSEEIFNPGGIGYDIEKKVKKVIAEFCERNLFLKGYKIKCPTCSSNIWYSINQTQNQMTCTGCQNSITFPIDPDMHYVINDLVRKNIYRTSTSPDGNLTVIRTLAKLREYFNSFYFSPQLDVFLERINKPFGDLDLICVGDGKLIIGECKHDSAAFMEKDKNGLNSLDKLVNIAKIVEPEIVVISCSKDQNNKLERSRKYLKHKLHNKNIDAVSLKIVEKRYFSMDYIYQQ
ncbi:hypothetical protein L0663_10355 [Dyadobacter sp. CY107]|uniref:hypothetical protein n=1 Tax=Dyadobacter fanqingshengii TaxID=2906443 RepID=UPI001F1BE643|nr:hypothetical protein [Dyadobacter fanqingshengii]MCF2503779.1 hypothetical protein [Dyadobacter fanqingshengii]